MDLADVRLWPMEGEDGPLLQELFDDLADFRTAFGEPGQADAVSTFLALPEEHDHTAKLLLGIWRDGGLAGALDCIMGYPTSAEWTIGLLVVAERHRTSGIATSVLTWLARTAAERGAVRLRAVLREGNTAGLDFAASRGFFLEQAPSRVPGHLVVTRPVAPAAPVAAESAVVLVEVDEAVLEELVRVATTDASANDVTPPLTAGDSWSQTRVAWLRDFHRGRREGLAGPKGESTWAVADSSGVIGSVRLKRTESVGVLETGIWLARSVRGRGLGTVAAAAVVQLATALGATAVRADTTSTNVGALAVLERTGFRVSRADSSGAIRALVETGPAMSS